MESMLLAGQAGQGGGTFGDDAAQLGTETQKTVKINHLSFNENGEKQGETGFHTSATRPWSLQRYEATQHEHTQSTVSV